MTHSWVGALFTEAFRGLGTINGEYKIRLKADAVPFALSMARRVPIPLREGVKVQLEKIESQKVIRRVEGPTDWCAGMVPVLQPSGEVRICADLTGLNDSVLRERYMLPSVDETLCVHNVYERHEGERAEQCHYWLLQHPRATVHRCLHL